MNVSTSNSASSSGSAIDVGSIVESLMATRQAPLKKIERKISQETLTVGSLAKFVTKLSRLNDAVWELQSSANFSSVRKATSSDPTVASASLTSVTQIGTYVVWVQGLAGFENPEAEEVYTSNVYKVFVDGDELTSEELAETGLELEINSIGVTTIRVTADAAGQAKISIREFVDAHNDLVAFYRSSASELSSNESPENANLTNNQTARSVMSSLANFYIRGNTDNLGNPVASFGKMGVRYLNDGKLSLNEKLLDSALSSGLASTLASGVVLGSSTSGSLSTFLTYAVNTQLPKETANITKSVRSLRTDQKRLEDNLANLRQKYLSQFSVLDAQLSKFESVRKSLDSMLISFQKS